jgi:hypothetical protein
MDKQTELNIDYIKSKCSPDWSVSNISVKELTKQYRVIFNLEHIESETKMEITLWESSIEQLQEEMIKHLQ